MNRNPSLLALGDAGHEAALLALAGELGANDADVAGLHAGIGVLADRLDGTLRDPAGQLDQLSERVAEGFAVADGTARPDLVLRDRRGDELTIATLIAAAAER